VCGASVLCFCASVPLCRCLMEVCFDSGGLQKLVDTIATLDATKHAHELKEPEGATDEVYGRWERKLERMVTELGQLREEKLVLLKQQQPAASGVPLPFALAPSYLPPHAILATHTKTLPHFVPIATTRLHCPLCPLCPPPPTYRTDVTRKEIATSLGQEPLALATHLPHTCPPCPTGTPLACLAPLSYLPLAPPLIFAVNFLNLTPLSPVNFDTHLLPRDAHLPLALCSLLPFPPPCPPLTFALTSLKFDSPLTNSYTSHTPSIHATRLCHTLPPLAPCPL
jgi:hypothetical protein